MMYHEGNSGRFGRSSVRQIIVVGTATTIDELKINCPASVIKLVYIKISPQINI